MNCRPGRGQFRQPLFGGIAVTEPSPVPYQCPQRRTHTLAGIVHSGTAVFMLYWRPWRSTSRVGMAEILLSSPGTGAGMPSSGCALSTTIAGHARDF